MKLRAKRDFDHAAKKHKAGDVLDVPDHAAKQLIDEGQAEPHPDHTQEPVVFYDVDGFRQDSKDRQDASLTTRHGPTGPGLPLGR